MSGPSPTAELLLAVGNDITQVILPPLAGYYLTQPGRLVEVADYRTTGGQNRVLLRFRRGDTEHLVWVLVLSERISSPAERGPN